MTFQQFCKLIHHIGVQAALDSMMTGAIPIPITVEVTPDMAKDGFEFEVSPAGFTIRGTMVED